MPRENGLFWRPWCRAADLLCQRIGPLPHQQHVYDGHAEIELGLLRLYEATGCRRYLDLARYFVDERGKQPCFFLTEALLGDNDEGANDKWFGPDHHQAHMPVRLQRKADGHAVKVTYLYSARGRVGGAGRGCRRDTVQRLPKRMGEYGTPPDVSDRCNRLSGICRALYGRR